MISEILGGGLFKANDGRDLVSSEIQALEKKSLNK